MKLKSLDYIPFVSWVNTYRRIKNRHHPSEEKTQNVYDKHSKEPDPSFTQKTTDLNESEEKIWRIVGTAIPIFGNGALGIRDGVIKIIEKYKESSSEVNSDEEGSVESNFEKDADDKAEKSENSSSSSIEEISDGEKTENKGSFHTIEKKLMKLEQSKETKFHKYDESKWEIFLLISDKMDAREIWEDPQFLKIVHRYLQCASHAMELYFNELTELTNNDLKEIAREMVAQPQSLDDEDYKFYGVKGEGKYCFPFFTGSVTDMYHRMRNYSFFISERNDDFGNPIKSLSSSEPDPQAAALFFKKGTVHFKCREIYNDFCDLLGKKLRRELKQNDIRFINWSTKDTNKKHLRIFCGEKPTP